jgi:hypothetical protein
VGCTSSSSKLSFLSSLLLLLLRVWGVRRCGRFPESVQPAAKSADICVKVAQISEQRA